MFSQKDAVSLVKHAVDKSHEDGGFILSKQMKTVNMYELACVMSDNVDVVGLRPGEKLNETLISEKEIPYTFILDDYVYISPTKTDTLHNVRLIKKHSSANAKTMSKQEMQDLVWKK